nr:MAG TPA: hypothetical protein [Caudoviricetes sp.]DAR40930.1 MAG TPA: hypothetical protein [Bacteriophage sp.]
METRSRLKGTITAYRAAPAALKGVEGHSLQKG